MANELVIHYPTGSTLYALLFDATGQVYNGSTFAAPGSASWTDYDIAMTEVATATGIYRASMPAVAAGAYGWVVRKQAGGSPAASDPTVGAGSIRWTGTAEEAVPAAVNVTLWAGNAVGDAPATVADLPSEPLDAAGTRTALGLGSANLDTQLADLPTVAEFEARTLPAADYTIVSDLPSVPTAADNADAVWDEATAGHSTAGTTGAALIAAGNAGDLWSTEVPGSYDAGTAGAVLGGLPAVLANVGATVTVVSAVSGGDITVYANDTWEFTVSSDSISLSGYEALALVVKRTASQDDSDALLYLRSDSGLQRIDGAAPDSAANGTLASTATSFTGTVAISETAGVTARSNYVWWLKGFDTTPTPDEGFTLATGKFTIMPAGLQAIA